MKNVVVIIGKSIKNNKIFLNYLQREIDKHLNCIDTLYFLDKNSCDLFLEIEEILSKYQNIIICAKDSFNLIGKILSTLIEDVLISQKNTLTPSKAIKIKQNSYLLQVDQKLINVLKIDELHNMPQILINNIEKNYSFFLFSNDNKDLEKIKKLALDYDGNIIFTHITYGLFFIELNYLKYQTKQGFIDTLKNILNDKIIIGKNISQIITQKLIKHNKKVACAESCTGGMLSSEIVKNSGVSAIFDGSIVSYSNDTKNKILKVRQTTLEKFGAVSKECVKEMLDGIKQLFCADFSLAISGIAGPTGGTKQKPVGTVIIGVKTKNNTLIEKVHFQGDRNYIQKQALFYALKLLILSDKKLFFNKS